jgi:hypothetical protein
MEQDNTRRNITREGRQQEEHTTKGGKYHEEKKQQEKIYNALGQKSGRH